jgi:hypothetical protein
LRGIAEAILLSLEERGQLCRENAAAVLLAVVLYLSRLLSKEKIVLSSKGG